MRLVASKPYSPLGIGDVVSLGMVSGHTFVFKSVPVVVPESFPDQQWLRAWYECPELPVGMVVADNQAHMEYQTSLGLLQTRVTLRLTAPQCAELAALLLNAAMVLETQAEAELAELAELEADMRTQAEAGGLA